MRDAWDMYQTTMDGHVAFISYSNGYADIAETDDRRFLLIVRVKFKNPTATGMPASEEFPALVEIDEKLDEALTNAGAVYVGRITVSGYRYFHYFTALSEEKAAQIVDRVSREASYDLPHSYKEDAAKDGYWKDLYPTRDDFRVLRDMKVLDALKQHGDQHERPREVSHWTYFPDEASATDFAEWAADQGYQGISIEPADEDDTIKVRFNHVGTMVLEDISNHTIAIARAAEELGGEYDGWETSVET